ncbi:hypothetical protein K439DRAFT_810002 [Ramaria rubella]|nr:hypothetical protein K439DRAFT_810002 [Ramaria rubella]
MLWNCKPAYCYHQATGSPNEAAMLTKSTLFRPTRYVGWLCSHRSVHSCCSLFVSWKFTSYSVGLEVQNYLSALNLSAWEPKDVYSTPELDNIGPRNLSIQFTENPHEYRHDIHSCAAHDRFQAAR